jgi:hypothetical protein
MKCDPFVCFQTKKKIVNQTWEGPQGRLPLYVSSAKQLEHSSYTPTNLPSLLHQSLAQTIALAAPSTSSFSEASSLGCVGNPAPINGRHTHFASLRSSSTSISPLPASSPSIFRILALTPTATHRLHNQGCNIHNKRSSHPIPRCPVAKETLRPSNVSRKRSRIISTKSSVRRRGLTHSLVCIRAR